MWFQKLPTPRKVTGNCTSPENIHNHTKNNCHIGNSEGVGGRGGGVLNSQILEGKYEAKLEIPGKGGGVWTK